MSAYKHGVSCSEIPTSILPPTRIEAGLPVIVGTAPLHLAAEAAKANEVTLCYSYSEAVTQFGYSDDWEKYTICEVMKSHFALFNMAPLVIVNVLDPAKHKENKTAVIKRSADVFFIEGAVLLPTLTVKADENGEPLVLYTDYTAAYNDDEAVAITPLDGGAIGKSIDKLYITYDALDAEQIEKDDIIGGVDITTGDLRGLELVNQVFPKLRLIPGLIVAPKWSVNPEVAAVMKAKQTNINGHFSACSLVDIPTTGENAVKKYSDAPAWKNDNNINNTGQFVFWPKVALDGTQYHLSTQALGVICATDAAHEDVPYKSPSNENLQCNAAVLADGKEILLGTDSAAYLNGQGIVTALNFIGGWKLWGNRTSVYPAVTDPKDSFIPVRRMFNWVENTLVTTFWQKIDEPTNRRLVKSVVDSANVWLNGLVARQFLLGAEVSFREDENPTTDLMDGIMRFHTLMTPPSPARSLEFIQEYYPDYFSSLFKE